MAMCLWGGYAGGVADFFHGRLGGWHCPSGHADFSECLDVFCPAESGDVFAAEQLFADGDGSGAVAGSKKIAVFSAFAELSDFRWTVLCRRGIFFIYFAFLLPAA